MKNHLKALLLLAVCSFVFACSNDDPIPEADDYTNILSNTGESVILKTYDSLSTKAQELFSIAQDLLLNPDVQHLAAARDAWIQARSPWEQSEGFLFGPVDQEGLDPSLDSWPVNVTDLDNVLKSANPITIEFLQQQEGTLKGFHTIEYLLWGHSGEKQIQQFTQREFEYLSAACGALAHDAKTLFDLWSPTGENYVQQLIKAGNGSQIYISQKAAIEEMSNALIIIADEVGNGKINDPFTQKDVALEESRFSSNSKRDFADNMRSILNIYTGNFGNYGNGYSISDIIQEKDPLVHQEILSAISFSIASIENIPGDFSDAIFNHASSVELAQTNVRSLQRILEEKLLPIISNL